MSSPASGVVICDFVDTSRLCACCGESYALSFAATCHDCSDAISSMSPDDLEKLEKASAKEARAAVMALAARLDVSESYDGLDALTVGDVVQELVKRLSRASTSLRAIQENADNNLSRVRLSGKIEGIELARGYVDEILRITGPDRRLQ